MISWSHLWMSQSVLLGKDISNHNHRYVVQYHPSYYTCTDIKFLCGETASGRRRKARAPQIARAEEPQAQDARATKQARPQTKKEEST